MCSAGVKAAGRKEVKEMDRQTNDEAYIQVKGLRVDYDGVCAIEQVNIAVSEGEFVSILGPSGCGKSTLLQVLSGLLVPTSGSIQIAGVQVGKDRKQTPPIGYVFQEHRLLPWRTVTQNLEIVLSACGVPRQEWEPRISQYLSMLEIDRFRNSWPMRLSGGQRQRVSIARALAVHPAVVLMDEPFSTLDEVTARTMRQELLNVWDQNRRTVLFVTHSIREALFLSDRIVILTRGPAKVLDVVTVPLSRPRQYEDPRLTEFESKIVNQVMQPWGYDIAKTVERDFTEMES
jgi:NitT/TauT family transport system ATP-binding protein